MDKKEIIEYFRGNIFEAKSHYIGYKMIFYARSNGVVSNEMAQKYVSIQKKAGSFFKLVDRALLISFVILICHIFDKRKDVFSLVKIDKDIYNDFYEKNELIILKLKQIRDEVLAHRNNEHNINDTIVPSINELDNFFKDLESFYNKLCEKHNIPITTFINSENIKNDIEFVYMNLDRGETMRLKDIEIRAKWENSSEKISDKI